MRDAKFQDLEVLLPLAHEAHANSRFSDLEINDAVIQRNFVVAIRFGQFAKVIEVDGRVVGGMVGCMGENNMGIRCARDFFCFSRGGTHILISAYKAWAKERGAQIIQISDQSGNSRFQKLITGLGFESAGTNFVEVA